MRPWLALLILCAQACSADAKTIGGDADAGPPPFSLLDPSVARDAAVSRDASTHDGGLSHAGSGSMAGAGGAGTAGAAGTSTDSTDPDDTGITTNPVPYNQIFCDAPDVTGQTIVTPCVTAIEFGSTWGRPTPGGSHCNDGWYYTISVVTNMFYWHKCMDGANPGDPWEPNDGAHKLTDAEMTALLKSLEIMTLSSATDCAGMDDVKLKTVFITTRTAVSKYTDSHYGCYIEEIFVDHIDDALAIVDAMAH